MQTLTMEQRAELRADFAYNDRDGDGHIAFPEFCALLDNLDAEMSAEEKKLGFHEIDTDKNGAIDFDEFVAWWGRV
jgi:calmodulin